MVTRTSPDLDPEVALTERVTDAALNAEPFISDRQLLRQALDRASWAYADLYSLPPVFGGDWTAGDILKGGITEDMVARRRERVVALVRDHGQSRGWRPERIQALIERATAVWLERDDPRLNRLGYRD